jgi:hypothetical protein
VDYQHSYTTDQWLRKCSLLLVSDNKVLDLSEFRIHFRVRQAEQSQGNYVPNTAEIRIYNLADTTSAGIFKEYSRVVLQAGYQTGKFAVIFDGTIKQFRRGHESVVDAFLDIYAADGDTAFNFSMSKFTLPAGWTDQQKIDRLLEDFKKMGVERGYIGVGGGGTGGVDPPHVRPDVQYGMSRQGMDEVTTSIGATWSIVNGKLNIVPLAGYLPNEAVQLNAQTGLIGWPEQTEYGIYIRCLLNPMITVASLVQINNKDINQTISPAGQLQPSENQGQTWTGYPLATDLHAWATVTDDGFYKVMVVDHQGDTRGNSWYSDLVCLQADVSSRTTTDVPVPVPDSSSGPGMG